MALTREQIQTAATSYGLDYATVAAVASVESSGNGFNSKTGFPIVLFEGHHFSRLTNHQYDLTNPTISYPKWTKKFYSGTSTGEEQRLQDAIKLNRIAALQSASYGMFQIMGFNFAACGCKDVQDLVNQMCKSEESQLNLFLKFVKSQGLIPHLKSKNWAKFAAGYNGPEYAKNSYDVKLAKAYQKFQVA